MLNLNFEITYNSPFFKLYSTLKRSMKLEKNMTLNPLLTNHFIEGNPTAQTTYNPLRQGNTTPSHLFDVLVAGGLAVLGERFMHVELVTVFMLGISLRGV